MRTKKFFDLNQASSYLRGSVIRVDDEPIYVHDVQHGEGRGNKGMSIEYSVIREGLGKVFHIDVADKKVDMTPVPLGMCSYHDGDSFRCYYIMRLPVRKWKIGLTKENIDILTVQTGQNAGGAINMLFPQTFLVDCIEGKYVGLTEAIKALKRRRGVIPFSRRFAIDHEHSVWYKGHNLSVGWFENGQVNLDKDHTYLSEIMMEDTRANP